MAFHKFAIRSYATSNPKGPILNSNTRGSVNLQTDGKEDKKGKGDGREWDTSEDLKHARKTTAFRALLLGASSELRKAEEEEMAAAASRTPPQPSPSLSEIQIWEPNSSSRREISTGDAAISRNGMGGRSGENDGPWSLRAVRRKRIRG